MGVCLLSLKKRDFGSQGPPWEPRMLRRSYAVTRTSAYAEPQWPKQEVAADRRRYLTLLTSPCVMHGQNWWLFCMFSVGALWTPVLGSGCGGGGIPHTGTLGGIHPDPNSTSSHGEKSAEPRWKRPREPDWKRTARRDDDILDVKRRAGAVIPVDLEITTRLAAKSALHCDPKDPVETVSYTHLTLPTICSV